MNRQGHFIWYELATPNMESATAFYTEVVGWRATPGDGSRPYTNLRVGDTPVAGVTTLAAADQPPHWTVYVDVENMDTSIERVTALGGQVLDAPSQRDHVGTVARVADPTGAALGLFQSGGQPMPPFEDEAPRVGDISWTELSTTDWDRARTFYNALFGWREQSTVELPGGVGTYWMFQAPGSEVTLGGMGNMAKAMNVPPHWLPYFYVGDLDAAIGRVEAKGGKVVNGPMEIPGGDRVAQCDDPEGAPFAIHGT